MGGEGWHRAPSGPVGPVVVGVLLGLEMMRRLDPDAIDDHTALATLRGAVGATRPQKELTR